MPIDRIQVIKQESTAYGGKDSDDEIFSVPLNPQEDAVETAGIFLQDNLNRDENVLIWRDGNNIKAKDPAHGTVTLLDSSVGRYYYNGYFNVTFLRRDTSKNIIVTGLTPTPTNIVGFSIKDTTSVPTGYIYNMSVAQLTSDGFYAEVFVYEPDFKHWKGLDISSLTVRVNFIWSV